MLKRKLVIALAVLAAAAFAGGAYASTRDSSTNARQAFLNDVAKRLHVTPAQLNSALTGALQDQLNAAVKAGKLTQAQADKIEQRIKANGGVPFFGPLFAPGRPRGRWANRWCREASSRARPAPGRRSRPPRSTWA